MWVILTNPSLLSNGSIVVVDDCVHEILGNSDDCNNEIDPPVPDASSRHISMFR